MRSSVETSSSGAPLVRVLGTQQTQLVEFHMPVEGLVIEQFNHVAADTRRVGSNADVSRDALAPETDPEFSVLPPRSVPIQLWEGEVQTVDRKAGVMFVRLSAKMGDLPDHTAEIDLQWVHDQDDDLVVPGGVFYWTIFKEIKRGSIRNAEELRFRRLPNWTKDQIRRIYERAEATLQRGRAKRTAE